MNRALANAVKAHLEATGHHVAVGQRPADVTGALPFCVVHVPSSTFEEDDVESGDRAGDHLVRLQVWGSTYDSAGMLAQDLDDRMKVPGIAPDGHVVTLVKRDHQTGPTRDDDTYPEPSRFRIDLVFRIWTEDSTV